MGISGYEVAVMSTIGPLTLEIRSLRRLIGSILPYSNLGLMGLAGLLAFTITTPEYRLGAVSLAVWEGCAGCVGTWWRDRHEPAKFEARVMSWTIGLVASSVAKYAFWTNNPIWPVMNHTNGGWNTTGLLLFVLALVRIYTRRDVMAPPAGSCNQIDAPRPKGTSALAGLGFGGLMFGLHSLLSDSSTMVLWVWTGYPVEGPLPVPHGSWIHFAMVSGLIFGVFCPSLARSWTAFGVGSLGAAFVTLFDDWSGFYGGLVLGFYLCALTPVIIGNGVRFSPGRTFGFGFFVYNIMVLFHVWVVAYAFVPGGPLVREHTDWVMLTMMLLIGAGVFSAIANSSEGVQGPSSSDKRRAQNPAAKRNRSYYIYVLLILQLLSVSISYLRFPSYNYTPHHPDSKSITAGIWTIHFSIDNDMWSSERRMASLIRESELDVVGLLESDLQRIIMGNRDTTQYLAEELGMYVDQGPGPDQHTWGCALLSKFPIVNSTHHLLPSPVGELAPAIHATIDAYGTLVDVFVFHSGQEEDPEDRRLQTEYLSDLMGASTRPSILLSYLVVKPGEGNYNTWVSERSGMNDIDPSDWDRWCEYILYKGLRKTGYARLSRGTITDTELQVGKFVVGEPEGTGELIKEDQVPEDLRFPALFRGEGVRGHRYHVFDEPRYFA